MASPPAPESSTTAAEAWRHMRTLVLDLYDRRQDASAIVGLSILRIKALRLLTVGPLTMRELATRLGADPPYVTLIVDDLQERALVIRTVHPTDRRAKLVSLTDAGRETQIRAEEVLAEPPAALRELPVEQLTLLNETLERLIDAS